MGLWLLTRCTEPPPPPLPPPPAPPPELVLPSQGLLENPQHLQRVFKRLHQLEKGEPIRLGIVQFGASHTASLAFTDELHARLGTRFGDLGPGFVPAAPMRATFAGAPEVPDSERGRVRVRWTGQWEIENALHAPGGQVWSLAGSRLRGLEGAQLAVEFGAAPEEEPSFGDDTEGLAPDAGPPAPTALAPPPDAEAQQPGRVELFYVEEPGMARLGVTLDGEARPLPRPRGTRPAAGAAAATPQVQVASFETSARPRALNVQVSGKGAATLLGVSYERKGRGIVFDTLGLSGSSVWVTERYQKPALVKQLKARQPSLFLVFFGTNESVSRSFDAQAYRKRYTSLLKTFRQGAADSDCLLISNTDREVPADGGWVEAPAADEVEQAIAEVAKQSRCAYWSSRAAMGGSGGMQAWMEQGLALPDRTHLTEEGYRRMAQLLLSDFLGAYDRSLLRPAR